MALTSLLAIVLGVVLAVLGVYLFLKEYEAPRSTDNALDAVYAARRKRGLILSGAAALFEAGLLLTLLAGVDPADFSTFQQSVNTLFTLSLCMLPLTVVTTIGVFSRLSLTEGGTKK